MAVLQEYIKAEQGGYDYSTKRWRDEHGRFSSREKALGIDEFIQGIVHFNLAPRSESWEIVERTIGGLSDIAGYGDTNKLLAALQSAETQVADPMPSDILAMMKLAEYFCRVEGDVWQTIEIPINVGLKDLVIRGADKGLETQIKELYDQSHLDMLDLLTQIWLSVAIYGMGIPLEAWDKGNCEGVFLLNPKYVRIGSSLGATGWTMGLVPESEEWLNQLKEQKLPSVMYDCFASDWNEYAVGHKSIPIKPEVCKPVRALAPAFNRYPIPPLARAMRSISTRQILEELIRATIEGYKNQLWVSKLGDADHPATPNEIATYRGLIEGAAGDRTGHIIWNHRLEIEQHTPRPLDQMLGSDKWQALTQHIMRQLGISLRLISGEGPLNAARGAEVVDIKVFIERLEYWRLQVVRWAHGFNLRWAERNKVKADKLPVVSFGRMLLEIEDLIGKRLQPLVQFGLLSSQTALEEAGYDYETELERKTAGEEDAWRFLPPPTFAQTTVNPETPEKQVVSTPKGRPPDVLNPKQALKASQQYETYLAGIMTAFDAMLQSSDRSVAVQEFVQAVADANARYMREAAQEGYLAAGGAGGLDEDDRMLDSIGVAIEWNDEYLERFGQELLGIEDGAELEKQRQRASLYAQEGDKIGYMFGVFLAMAEYGARGWRRVLHPERSVTGPCEACIADSALIHPIEEPFFEFHPSGVCTPQSVYFYRTERPTEEIPIPFVIPTRRGEKRIVRRQR